MRQRHSFDSALSASTREESIEKNDTLEDIIERSNWEDKLEERQTNSIWDALKWSAEFLKLRNK